VLQPYTAKPASKRACHRLEVAGFAKLRTGNAPTITRGPYRGELATVDHIIPRSVCPELDNVLINLEFLPATLNAKKGNKVGEGLCGAQSGPAIASVPAHCHLRVPGGEGLSLIGACRAAMASLRR